MGYLRVILMCFALFAQPSHADDNTGDIQLALWVNEAIITTYTYNYGNYLTQQKTIASYYTAKGWIAYSNALIASKLPEAVEKNKYYVSAVATMPPQITKLHDNYWRAMMPILVIYKNPQYQQKQSLNITLEFSTTTNGLGVRGLAITSLQSKIIKPPCQCATD